MKPWSKIAGIYLPNAIQNAVGAIANIVEFCGTIHPCDFADEVIFTRDCVDGCSSILYPTGAMVVFADNHNMARGVEPFGNDENWPDFQDRSPQPNGRIFDVDTPGLVLSEARSTPYGTTMFYRYNFIQYARYGGRRCSNDFPWFCRLTARRGVDEDAFPDVFFLDREGVIDDNVVANGNTEVDE